MVIDRHNRPNFVGQTVSFPNRDRSKKNLSQESGLVVSPDMSCAAAPPGGGGLLRRPGGAQRLQIGFIMRESGLKVIQ